jgi:hypothetical protein
MSNIYVTLPIVVHAFYIISENRSVLDSYLFRIFEFLGTADPVRLFMSIMVQQFIGVRYQSHYNEIYPDLKNYFSYHFSLYCGDKIKETVSRIGNSMAAWKLLLFLSSLIKSRCPQLLYCPSAPDGKKVADIDVTTVQSASSGKEGAEAGYKRKNKGKPCFQLSATFIGRVFVDAKLFPGCTNPKDFFQKAVKRVISLGYGIEIIRADRAYMTLGNLLFLTGLSLGYAIGAPANFNVVSDGIELLKSLARKKSSRIVHVGKGVALPDLGWVTLTNGVRTRIVIVRRINRKKKKGRWQKNTYCYAIATNLMLSAAELYRFYHKRQCIEAGFRELKNHYSLERLPFQSLKANEFRIVCKIAAMTLFKIFQTETLPKSLQHLLRKTFLRRIFQKGLCSDESGKVQAVPKTRYTWHLRRLLCKIERMKPDFIH